MSENLLLTWIRSLSTMDKHRLVARILRSDALPAVTVLSAFSEASGLSSMEVSGLLPTAIRHAEAAAAGLIHTPTLCSALRRVS